MRIWGAWRVRGGLSNDGEENGNYYVLLMLEGHGDSVMMDKVHGNYYVLCRVQGHRDLQVGY